MCEDVTLCEVVATHQSHGRANAIVTRSKQIHARKTSRISRALSRPPPEAGFKTLMCTCSAVAQWQAGEMDAAAAPVEASKPSTKHASSSAAPVENRSSFGGRGESGRGEKESSRSSRQLHHTIVDKAYCTV